MTLLLALATAFAGGCQAIAADLVQRPDFHASFEASTIESAKTSFLSSFATAFSDGGPPLSPADVRFIRAFWDPRVEAAITQLLPDYDPILEEWIVASVGCKSLKKSRKKVAAFGWEALPPDGLAQMEINAPLYLSQGESARAIYAEFELILEPSIAEFSTYATSRWPQ
jgi:hypothetical protein